MTDFSLTELNEKISQKSTFVKPLLESIEKIVVGQKEIVQKIIIGLLCKLLLIMVAGKK